MSHLVPRPAPACFPSLLSFLIRHHLQYLQPFLPLKFAYYLSLVFPSVSFLGLFLPCFLHSCQVHFLFAIFFFNLELFYALLFVSSFVSYLSFVYPSILSLGLFLSCFLQSCQVDFLFVIFFNKFNFLCSLLSSSVCYGSLVFPSVSSCSLGFFPASFTPVKSTSYSWFSSIYSTFHALRS